MLGSRGKRAVAALGNRLFIPECDIGAMPRAQSPIPCLWTQILVAGALAGCCASPVAPILGAMAPAQTLLQRTPVDAVVSLVTGLDCSAVRWDGGRGYCVLPEPPPPIPPYCSNSLGGVDCWRDPALLANRPHELANGPRFLTVDQQAYRTCPWPFF